jgi:hypothetical protein
LNPRPAMATPEAVNNAALIRMTLLTVFMVFLRLD